MAQAGTIEEAVTERFYEWAYVGPIGNALAAAVWLNEVAAGSVSVAAQWTWALVTVAACSLMLLPVGCSRCREWKTELGVPKLSILSLGLMGTAWGATLWLGSAASSDPTFVFGTAAVLFSIVAGTFVGNTGCSYASSALLAPLGVGFAAGLMVSGYGIPALGIVAFSALTVPAFVDSARVTQELIGLQIESENVASHDPLTGLLNRRGLRRRLETLDPSTAVALLFIDLDGFKGVNDQFGHEEGDAVLQICAKRLVQASPPGTFVARMGGDEFVVVFVGEEGDVQVNAVRVLGQALVASLSNPMAIGRRRLRIAASAGLSFGRRSDYDNGLVRSADEAMMAAKQAGGDRMHVVEAGRRTPRTATTLWLVGDDDVIIDSSESAIVGPFSEGAEAALLRSRP